jgi:sulfur carrier protein ThiS
MMNLAHHFFFFVLWKDSYRKKRKWRRGRDLNSRGGDASSLLLALRACSRLPPFRARLPRLGHANGVPLFLCFTLNRLGTLHQDYLFLYLSTSVPEGKIRIKVAYKSNDKLVEVDESSSVEDLLRSLNLFVDAHIVTSSNRPLPITHRLHDGEELVIIQVASGG